MPNRIIKESICTSSNLNLLTPEEEVFFYRILVGCDDYGRLDGRAIILRSKCFPLKVDVIKDSHIENWLTSLAKQKLIGVYIVEDCRYIQVLTWENHQQIRAKRSKYPDAVDGYIPMSDSNGNHLITDDSNSPRNPIQSNPIRIQSESNLNPDNPQSDLKNVFEYWNEQGIKKHRVMTPDMETSLKNSLKYHTLEELRLSIGNYSEILKHPELYSFEYHWTLKDYLTRGFEKFIDLDIAKTNYKRRDNNGGNKNYPGQQKGSRQPGNTPGGAFRDLE